MNGISDIGFAALWITFAVMMASTIGFYIMYLSAPDGIRRFYGYTIGITGFASVAYLTMALGKGFIYVGDHQFVYARYLDWIFTTPLLLLDLASLAGVNFDDYVTLLILDVLMILAGISGGCFAGPETFYFWSLGCLFFIPIIYDLSIRFKRRISKKPAVSASYRTLTNLTIFLWVGYPIIFYHAEYTHKMGPDAEVIAYAMLDILSKCLFGFILLTRKEALQQHFTFL